MAEQRAIERAIDIVDRNNRAATQQRRDKPLIEFDVVLRLIEHGCPLSRRDHAANIDELGLAGTGNWRRERVHWCRIHGAAVEGRENGRQRDRFICVADKREGRNQVLQPA